jgi:hypothetical protein
MLIPQYTIRWLLGLTTVCAVICSIFALALRGSSAAAAVSIAILALVVVALVHIALFALVWAFSAIFPPRVRVVTPPSCPFRALEEPATPILLE